MPGRGASPLPRTRLPGLAATPRAEDRGTSSTSSSQRSTENASRALAWATVGPTATARPAARGGQIDSMTRLRVPAKRGWGSTRIPCAPPVPRSSITRIKCNPGAARPDRETRPRETRIAAPSTLSPLIGTAARRDVPPGLLGLMPRSRIARMTRRAWRRGIGPLPLASSSRERAEKDAKSSTRHRSRRRRELRAPYRSTLLRPFPCLKTVSLHAGTSRGDHPVHLPNARERGNARTRRHRGGADTNANEVRASESRRRPRNGRPTR